MDEEEVWTGVGMMGAGEVWTECLMLAAKTLLKKCFCAAQHLHICLLMFTDPEVSCQFGQSCILPCSFQAGQSLIIHWYHLTPTKTGVHSYYDNKDQWGHQDQRFRGRMSLFQDQFSKGNASLQLTGVMVQDEGPYQAERCGSSES
uniref:Immunoglobulin V-set domain-containing protein n=1 Tax=Oryzias latipes TaxID=8090 RepID=A0A3P9HQV6_ORYLA